MPRAISMRHTVVPSSERDDFRAAARRTLAHYTTRGCHYWLFEVASLAGAYVEFFEAGDRETLQSAHRDAPQPVSDAARMYVEVQLN